METMKYDKQSHKTLLICGEITFASLRILYSMCNVIIIEKLFEYGTTKMK